MDNFLYYVRTYVVTPFSFDVKWQVQREKFMKKGLQRFPPCPLANHKES